ncbi:MAG: hypothetical protein KJ955_02745 [Nanoarchaeota archaeon]|nr:hypothetical protein [Nanoarchaeota archaeon]
MAIPIIRIEEVYSRTLERMLDDASIALLLDDRTNVDTVLEKVMGIMSLYKRNIRLMKGLQPEYARRLRMVERLFIAYQNGVGD